MERINLKGWEVTPGPLMRWTEPYLTNVIMGPERGRSLVATITGYGHAESARLIAALPAMLEYLWTCVEGEHPLHPTGPLANRAFAILDEALGTNGDTVEIEAIIRGGE